MAESKTSAISDEPINVLIALHPKFDIFDFAGPLSVFNAAQHDFSDECKYSSLGEQATAAVPLCWVQLLTSCSPRLNSLQSI